MAEIRKWLRHAGSGSDSLAKDRSGAKFQLNDESLVARFTRTSKLLPEQDNIRYVRYIHLVRFLFLILIGRFATLEA
jgi:hypothetical protein